MVIQLPATHRVALNTRYRCVIKRCIQNGNGYRSSNGAFNGAGRRNEHDAQANEIGLLKRQIAALQDKFLLMERNHDLQTEEVAKSHDFDGPVRPFDAQVVDRRDLGLFDARFHSTMGQAKPRDHRILPKRIILVRHGESEGNVDRAKYCDIPDPQIKLTHHGKEQAYLAGQTISNLISQDASTKLFFYISPYKRSLQTFQKISQSFDLSQIMGVQEEVQLREQDFGNFQHVDVQVNKKAERLRYGRFFYRFPNGESGADVYDRVTMFEDHLCRDINAGRFARDSTLVLVTHGLTLRIFLMRWFHWTVEQFLQVYNPKNAEPIVLERRRSITDLNGDLDASLDTWVHTKALYVLSSQSMGAMRGVAQDMRRTQQSPKGILQATIPDPDDPLLSLDEEDEFPIV